MFFRSGRDWLYISYLIFLSHKHMMWILHIFFHTHTLLIEINFERTHSRLLFASVEPSISLSSDFFLIHVLPCNLLFHQLSFLSHHPSFSLSFPNLFRNPPRTRRKRQSSTDKRKRIKIRMAALSSTPIPKLVSSRLSKTYGGFKSFTKPLRPFPSFLLFFPLSISVLSLLPLPLCLPCFFCFFFSFSILLLSLFCFSFFEGQRAKRIEMMTGAITQSPETP